MRDGLAEVAELLEADPAVDSDAWFLLSERSRRALWRMGSASYCLYEWAEPSDERADVDEDAGDEALDPRERARRRALRAGRRNIRSWQED